YLAAAFEQVIILPRYNPYLPHELRQVPSNVSYHEPITPQGWKRVLTGLFNRSPVGLFMQDFLQHKVYKKRLWVKNWFNSLLVYRITRSKYHNFLSTFDPDTTVLYSYWADGAFLTDPINKAFKKVVRVHSGDFYLE